MYTCLLFCIHFCKLKLVFLFLKKGIENLNTHLNQLQYIIFFSINFLMVFLIQIVKIKDGQVHHIFTIPYLMILHCLQILFWPFYNMFQTFLIRYQYQTSSGTEKNNLHQKLEGNISKTIRAKLFEGCLEASFQVCFIFLYLFYTFN